MQSSDQDRRRRKTIETTTKKKFLGMLSERVGIGTALFKHGQRVVVRAGVASKTVSLVSFFKRLFDGLDVDTSFKVVLAVESTQTIFDVVVVRRLRVNDRRLLVSTGTEDVGALGAGGRDASTSRVADRAFHGVLLRTSANGDTRVERREQRVDIELGEGQVEHQVQSGRGSEEEDKIDSSEQGGERTGLERHSDQLGDHVVGGSETGSRLVERKHERARDENVGERSKTEPQDNDDLELLELREKENNLDTNRSADGAEQRDGGADGDEGGHDLRVHQLVYTPGEEELGGKRNDTGHDGIGSKGAVTLVGVDEVTKVGDEVLVHEDLIEYGVDGVGDDEEEDKVPHEGLVVLKVDIVDVGLDDGETKKPNVEHDTDVHATQPV